MVRRTFAEKMNSAKVKAGAMRRRQADLANRGVDIAYLDNYDNLIATTEARNNEQEALKAALKAKTKEVDTALKAMEQKGSESDTIIKMNIPREGWVEFGITAKR